MDLLTHAQCERRSRPTDAGRGCALGVVADVDLAARTGHRDNLFTLRAGELAPDLAGWRRQRMQARRAGSAGRPK